MTGFCSPQRHAVLTRFHESFTLFWTSPLYSHNETQVLLPASPPSMLTFRSGWFVLLLLIVVYLLHFCTTRTVLAKANRAIVRQNEGEREVSRELFDSLEELARIVDISYCVGNTGVRKPFECLSRCDEFEGFDLIAVSGFYLYYLAPFTVTREVKHGC